MEEYTIIISQDIDETTRETIRHLLKKYHRDKNIDLSKVMVKEVTKNAQCSKCKHICTLTNYPVHDGGYSLIAYISCDCGYTYITNIGGMMFSFYPGEPSWVWGTSSTNSIINKTVTETEAARIIESKLVPHE